MKSIITISSVVFASAAAIALIGCKTESGFEDQNTGANGTPYYGGAVGRSQPAQNDQPPTGSLPPVIEVAPPEATPGPGTGDIAPPPPAPLHNIVTPEPTAETKKHTVKKNESLWIIAKNNGTTVDELVRANGITKNAILRPGQELIIPAKNATVATPDAAPADGSTLYVVKDGDVLGSIARKHHTSIAKIKAANGLKSDVIRKGQKLKIPAAAPATAPTGTTTSTTAPVLDPLAPQLPPPATGGTSVVPDQGFFPDSSGTYPAAPTSPANVSVPTEATATPSEATSGSTPVSN